MLSKNLENTLNRAINLAKEYNHEYATLEHLLLALTEDPDASAVFNEFSVNLNLLCEKLRYFLNNELQSIMLKEVKLSKPTAGFQRIVHRAAIQVYALGLKEMSGVHVLAEIFSEQDSYAVLFLTEHNLTRHDIISYAEYLKQKTQAAPSDATQNSGINLKPEETKDEQSSADPLNKYCVNLNKLALSNKIDTLIGRDSEIQRIIEILSRRNKNNPLLLGEPGVGKTAIVEGLAYCLVSKQPPESLQGATIYALDMGLLVAGTRYRGDFEERLKQVVKRAQELPSTILFIDEIHSIIGAGSTNGSALDASNLLKPMLARGTLRFIGSTTFKEYQNYFEKDAALARRFQKITIDEPSTEVAIEMLKGLKMSYERHHNVEYSDQAVEAAVILSDRYITDRRLPDKAIDVIDEAGAHCRINKKNDGNKIIISTNDIENIIANIAHIPAKSISQNESEKMLGLDAQLKKTIFGQDRVIDELVSILKLEKAGLRNHNKPMGCYLFSGPSGVGKTELAKQLAKALNMELLRFDMSEYNEKHSISKLIGSPPGYVGFDKGGFLTDEIRKTPYAVVLLDEIEKSHPDIHNVMLQVMDYGKLTDSSGVTVNFCHSIIIMTTNAGVAINKHAIGFNELKQIVINTRESNEQINKSFSSEFRNRLDAIIEFSPLSDHVISQIVEKYLLQLEDQLQHKSIKIIIDQNVKEYLCEVGFDTYNGARELEKIIDKKLKKSLADEILFARVKAGETIRVSLDNIKREVSFSYGSKVKENADSIVCNS